MNADIHQPVLLKEAMAMLRVVSGSVYMDGTFGLGGHTREILKRSSPSGKVIAFEWDEKAIEHGLKNSGDFAGRLIVVRRNFAEIDLGLIEAGHTKVEGILIDIGCSSLQLDRGQRGFSFQQDEYLDMRMDQRREITAAHIIATAKKQELADIFYYYGEETQSRRIADLIIEERKKAEVQTSGQLADLVAKAIPRKYHPAKIHVATRVFQALRIAVNEELANLSMILEKGAEHLVAGGRFCVIAFHSLEDRIVKRKFAANENLAVITKKPIVPAAREKKANPRSRSARMRVAERLA
ncbi:MAG: 16S rRNA (cytosine(1402)-N(4))-methyltransferase RsmH [Deltaproteobacteria bacterium]|nr:16S rRNA (cytosine(1402)-N(4))-methyltransferase RsmH [Deltaproteobacteria bacterium]